MAKFDVISIGSAVKDYTFYSDQGKLIQTPQNLTAQRWLAFEYGAKLSVNESVQGFGGGGANSSVSFSGLGLKAAVVTSIGSDGPGKEILENFKKKRVGTSFIQKNENVPTAISFIISNDKKDKEHIVFTERGADKVLKCDYKKISKFNAKWFYISGMSNKLWSNNLKEVFDQAKKKRTKIAWNPGGMQLAAGKKVLASFLKNTEVLILNKDEAIELVLSGVKLGNKHPNSLNKPIYLLNILREWGPRIVVITEGKKGAHCYDGKNIYKQKALSKKVVDTTGVGDAFGSGFIAGMIYERGSVEKALKWGALNSASVVTKLGAQNGLLTYKKIKEKL